MKIKNEWITIGAVSLILTVSSAGAAILTSVPMQGGMLMPSVTYHALDGSLTVVTPASVPQLTPLLASNPNDSFDPADPWFEFLDPSRQGLAFSRRYGFNMTTGSDPLPPGQAIWIQKVSGSPELGFYRYRSSSPKAWEPIFGTDHSAQELQWNQVMFHPGVTAPPGTNSYSAVFELFLRDTVTGEIVAGSHSEPVVMNWTTAPDGRPALTLAAKVAIAWPASTTANWILEGASSIPSTEWTVVTNTPVLLNGQPTVLLDPSENLRFFRMRRVP